MTREELIAALERAEGPSRELDAEIAWKAGVFDRYLRGVRNGVQILSVTPAHPDGDVFVEIGRPEERGRIRYCEIPAPFTSSIDAALTLVPAKHEALVYTTGAARVWPVEGRRNDDLSYGRTPAIALCIAALKARA